MIEAPLIPASLDFNQLTNCDFQFPDMTGMKIKEIKNNSLSQQNR